MLKDVSLDIDKGYQQFLQKVTEHALDEATVTIPAKEFRTAVACTLFAVNASEVFLNLADEEKEGIPMKLRTILADNNNMAEALVDLM